MGNRIYSPGQAADDHYLVPGQLGDDFLGYLPSVGGGTAGTDHCQAPLVTRLQAAPHIQEGRVVVDFFETGGVAVLAAGDDPYTEALQLLHLGVRGYTRPAMPDGIYGTCVQAGLL